MSWSQVLSALSVANFVIGVLYSQHMYTEQANVLTFGCIVAKHLTHDDICRFRFSPVAENAISGILKVCPQKKCRNEY